jgi:4-carboxymuconolactone decarboxylase
LPRIPLFTPDSMTPGQQRVYEAIVSGPRGKLVGPLRAALHCPELADKWQQLGEILRYRTSLPPRLSELAILVTARHCNCDLEWYIHEQMARQAGLEVAIIEEIRGGRRPGSADAEALVIYDYAEELNRLKTTSDAIYQRALKLCGVVGVVELTALIGYYTMVAMTLNAHGIPLPDGAQRPFSTA